MQHSPERPPKKKNDFNWVGILIFLLLILGPQIGRVVSHLVSSVSGGTMTISTSSVLPLLIGGLVAVTMLVAVGQAVRNASRRGESRLPTSMSPPPSMRNNLPRPSSTPYGRSSQPPTVRRQRALDQRGIETRQQSLPGPPKFEPIISGKVLIIGVLGLLLLAVIFGVAFLLMVSPLP